MDLNLNENEEFIPFSVKEEIQEQQNLKIEKPNGQQISENFAEAIFNQVKHFNEIQRAFAKSGLDSQAFLQG